MNDFGKNDIADVVTKADANPELLPQLRELFPIIWRKRLVVGIALGVTAIAVLIHHVIFPSYTSRSYLLIETEQENTGFQALLSTMSVAGERANIEELEGEKSLLVLRSPEFSRRWATEISKKENADTMLGLLNHPNSIGEMLSGKGDQKSLTWISEKLHSLVKFNSKVKGVIDISVQSSSRDLSVFLTNTLLETAVSVFSEREDKKLNVARDYIKTKIAETVQKMEGTDKRIVGISTKNANVSLLAPQSAISERLLQLKSEIQKLTFEKETNDNVIATLEAKIGPNAAGSSSLTASLMGAQKTLASLKAENSLMVARIASMTKELDNLVRSNLSAPKKEQDLADLQRQKGLDYYVFDNLFKTHVQLEVKGLSLLNRIYPLEFVKVEDVTPTVPILPKLLGAMFLAVLASSGAIVGLHVVNPVIREKKDFEGMGLNHLGSIPEFKKDYLDRFTTHNTCKFEIDSKETIAFKHIRSRILHLAAHSGEESRNVMAFLSYGNGEGKSFLSVNLAACFAYMGKRTLLIDFDIRRASLSKSFDLQRADGVCSVFDGKSDLRKCIVKDLFPHMDFMPAGMLEASTTEKVTNQRFNDFLGTLKAQYDYIIMDTAPLLVAHESLVIAKEVDFAILTSTCWKTKREYVKEAIEEVRHVRKKSVHYVLNRAQEVSYSLTSNYYYFMNTKNRQKLEAPLSV